MRDTQKLHGIEISVPKVSQLRALKPDKWPSDTTTIKLIYIIGSIKYKKIFLRIQQLYTPQPIVVLSKATPIDSILFGEREQRFAVLMEFRDQ